MTRTDILAWIDSRRDAMVRQVETWSRINTGTDNVGGIRRFADVLADVFGDLHGEISRIPLPPRTIINPRGDESSSELGEILRIVKRPQAKLRVLLCIHMDTVYPSDHPFQIPTMMDANTLRGPGVADAKGGIAIMLTALEALERSEHKENVGWEVLLNPDEEIGSVGSSPLLAEAAKRNHFGFLFEPAMAGGAIAGTRRGSGNFSIVIRGKPAHAGRDFESGRSAIVALADLIQKLHAINGKIPGVNVNIGKVEGGGPVNVVPDLAIGHINVRTGIIEDEAIVRSEIDRLIEEVNRRDGISARLYGAFTSPPKRIDRQTQQLLDHLIACGHDIGLNLSIRPSGGVCDGNKLAAFGLPNIDTLGPGGGEIHSDGEFIHLDSLTERAKLAALFLLKFASSEIVWSRL